MKLYNSSNSPYGRKVRVVALELGIQNDINLVDTNPRDPKTGLWELNPLAKIPALELDDGRMIYDSPVICEYLSLECGQGRRAAPARPAGPPAGSSPAASTPLASPARLTIPPPPAAVMTWEA
mgnify:CR=1 FL=1